jgi:hypothetical protein
MSDTRRRHESLSRQRQRGPKNKIEDGDKPHAVRKSHKQQRVNDRARLRKEYLR